MEFRVTFGQKYRNEGHPILREAHPDGWVTITAFNRKAAERFAREFFAKDGVALFAFLYEADDPNASWNLYPRGELVRLEAT